MNARRTRRRYHTVDVFTDRGFTGNPLAVFPRGEGLTSRQMTLLAREFGYSETAFVLPPEHHGNHARLRIFTPTGELPFAGHPTIGSAVVLATEKQLLPEPGGCSELLIEEEVGLVHVGVRQAPGRLVSAELTAPQLPDAGPPPPPLDTIAELLSLTTADLADRTGVDYPEAFSAGVPFLFVPVHSIEAVERVRFDPAVWELSLAGYWAPQIYVFSTQTRTAEATIHARMFSPAFGVPEDNGTGAAAVALAGYLAKRNGGVTGRFSYVIEQGIELGRPSLLYGSAELLEGKLTAVYVGGTAVPMSSGEMEIPPDG